MSRTPPLEPRPCKHEWKEGKHPHIRDMEVRECPRCGERWIRMMPAWTKVPGRDERREDWPE